MNHKLAILEYATTLTEMDEEIRKEYMEEQTGQNVKRKIISLQEMLKGYETEEDE